MDLGPLLEEILDVEYTTGSKEKQRRKAKRKVKLHEQVEQAVSKMRVSILIWRIHLLIKIMPQLKNTYEYLAGRTYRKKVSKSSVYLREERTATGVPESFSSLDKWLKERRVELSDFVDATTETSASVSRFVDDQDVVLEDVDVNGGDEGDLGNSDDEDFMVPYDVDEEEDE